MESVAYTKNVKKNQENPLESSHIQLPQDEIISTKLT